MGWFVKGIAFLLIGKKKKEPHVNTDSLDYELLNR